MVQGFVIHRPLPLRQGYNFPGFLSDFIKYYSKSPNYARNLVKSYNLRYESNLVTSKQLFNYLLSHESEYNFGVLRVEPVFVDRQGKQNF